MPARLVAGLAFVVAVAAGLAIGDAQAAKGKPTTSLVSRQSKGAGGAGGNDDSLNPSISADGRYVAFGSLATNLGGPATPGVDNIYVYDRKLKRTRLVSRRSGPNGAGANDDSFSPEISANGRFVAFATFATNLGGPIAPGTENVYVYDLAKQRVELVSRRSGPNGAGGNQYSYGAELSASGRHVVFATQADNLGGPINTGVENVYVRDRKLKRTQLVSRRSGPTGAGGNGYSFTGTLSANGRFVSFTTEATNLGGPRNANASSNIYVYDRKLKRVALVSRRSGPGGKGGNDDSLDAFIAGNGRFVGFESRATNLGGPIQTDPLDDDTNIYVYDRERKRVELVSRRSQARNGKGANDDSDDPVLSHNGRYVVFETNATNLGGPINPANGSDNAYLYDRKAKRVELVGRASGRKGQACDDDCEDPYISADGRFVAFEGRAQNFGGPIVPGTDNVWVRSLGR